MFESSKAKINWAKEHIRKLDPVMNAFLDSDFYRLWVEENEGNSVIKFQMIKKLPEVVPLIVGDALHNLRTALDYMANDIIQATGKTPDRYAHFPIREKRHDVISAINGWENALRTVLLLEQYGWRRKKVTARGAEKHKVQGKEKAKHPDNRPGAIGSLFGDSEDA